MKVQTYFSPAEVDPHHVAGRVAVVIDVIRATSTIVEALANGAAGVYPTLSTEDAIRLANSLGREDTLLCGERKGLKVEGFDLGNSPREVTREKVAGKRLAMSTTNGTRAFLATAGAERVLAASFLNLTAVSEVLGVDPEADLVFICSGREDRFSFDDALCAGYLIRALADRIGGGRMELADGALGALTLARSHVLSTALLARTAAGKALVDVGLADDLPHCADLDRHGFVPEMIDRVIRRPRKG